MTRGRRARGVLPAACAILAAGCAHRARGAFERSLRAGRWQDAALEFRADSGLQRDAEALREAARIHAVPDSATWNPARALELLGRSRTYTAVGGFPDADSRLEALLRHVVRVRAAQEARVLVLRDSVDRVRAEADRLRAQLAQMQESTGAVDGANAVLQRMVTRLESDLREREAQIAAITSELERLKAIDLRHPARPRP